MTGAAGHKELHDAFGFGSELRLAGHRGRRTGEQTLVGEKTGQRNAAQATAEVPEEITARLVPWLQRPSFRGSASERNAREALPRGRCSMSRNNSHSSVSHCPQGGALQQCAARQSLGTRT